MNNANQQRAPRRRRGATQGRKTRPRRGLRQAGGEVSLSSRFRRNVMLRDGFADAPSMFLPGNRISGAPQANQLQLHAPQLGHATSVFFEARRGTTPGGVIISGRELLGTAVGSSSAAGTYVNTNVAVIFSSANFSARLNAFAALYQKWRPRAIRATLVSNQATTTVGNNYLGFQTQAGASAPATGAALMRENGAVFGNAYSDISTVFDCKSLSVPWFSETGSGLATAGNLNIGTDGYSSAVVPGVVVIDYEVEFADPQ